MRQTRRGLEPDDGHRGEEEGCSVGRWGPAGLSGTLDWIGFNGRDQRGCYEPHLRSGFSKKINSVWDHVRTSLIAQLVKNPHAMQETLVQFLGWEDLLEKGKATHSSILAWRIPGSQRV